MNRTLADGDVNPARLKYGSADDFARTIRAVMVALEQGTGWPSRIRKSADCSHRPNLLEDLNFRARAWRGRFEGVKEAVAAPKKTSVRPFTRPATGEDQLQWSRRGQSSRRLWPPAAGMLVEHDEARRVGLGDLAWWSSMPLEVQA